MHDQDSLQAIDLGWSGQYPCLFAPLYSFHVPKKAREYPGFYFDLHLTSWLGLMMIFLGDALTLPHVTFRMGRKGC